MESLVKSLVSWFRSRTHRYLLIAAVGLVGVLRLLFVSTVAQKHPSSSAEGVLTPSVPIAARGPEARFEWKRSAYLPNELAQNAQTDGKEADAGQGPGAMRFPLDQPIMARSAELTVTAKDFFAARSMLEQILARRNGYAAELKVDGQGSSRVLTASLRVPVQEFQITLQELKQLGTVTNETQAAEEVTQPYMDLAARLRNAHETEARLTDVLRHRTGEMSEILEVEQQVSRVRGEIEQMQAELRALGHRVSFATVTLTIAEQYTAQFPLARPPVLTEIRNAFLKGLEGAYETVIAIVVLLAGSAPSLLLWVGILLFPARSIWRRIRARRERVRAVPGLDQGSNPGNF
jgi:hypothetical protein